MIKLASGVLVLLAVLPAALHAQVDDPTSPYAVFQLAERQDWLLRVTNDAGAVVEGRVREVDDASVRLEGGRAVLADVALIERGRREGGGAKKGAIIGGLAVGIASVAFAMFVVGVADGGGDTGAAMTGLVLGGVGLGALIGGIIGGATDPSSTEWTPIWPGTTAP